MSLDCNVTVLEDRRVVVQKQMSNVEWVILRCGRKREDWHSIGPNVRWEQNNRCSIGKMAPKRGNCWLFKSRSVSSPRPSPSLALLEHKHPNTISPLHTFLWNPTRSGSSWRQGRWSSRARTNLMIEEICVVVSVRSTWVVAVRCLSQTTTFEKPLIRVLSNHIVNTVYIPIRIPVLSRPLSPLGIPKREDIPTLMLRPETTRFRAQGPFGENTCLCIY